jgi:hypothetical protein
MNISKVRFLDLSNNAIGPRLAGLIGKKLRDEVFHFAWIDLTQNEFYNDANSITAIISGFKK